MQKAKIKVFIVSLRDSHERREKVSSQLHALKIHFEWIDAILGRALPTEEIRQYQLNQRSGGGRPYDITPGEIGCALSHNEAYRRIIEDGLDGAIILEDDIQLLDGFAEVVAFFQQSSSLVSSGSVVILGGLDGLQEKTKVTHSLWGSLRISGNYKLLVSVDSWFWRACSYYIDKVAAVQLLEFNRGVYAVADEWNYFLKKSIIERIMYVQPWVTEHPTGFDDGSILAVERASATASLRLASDSQSISTLRTIVRNSRRQMRRLIPNVRPRT